MDCKYYMSIALAENDSYTGFCARNNEEVSCNSCENFEIENDICDWCKNICAVMTMDSRNICKECVKKLIAGGEVGG